MAGEDSLAEVANSREIQEIGLDLHGNIRVFQI
jgi:hypothetical protein